MRFLHLAVATAWASWPSVYLGARENLAPGQRVLRKPLFHGGSASPVYPQAQAHEYGPHFYRAVAIRATRSAQLQRHAMTYKRKMRLGISVLKFADIAGCDPKMVRKSIASGHLTRLADGSMDPALAKGDWLRGTARSRFGRYGTTCLRAL